MLSEWDIPKVDAVMVHGYPDDSDRAAWSVNKTALAELGTTPNTCVMPLPSLDECVYMAVSADSGEGAFQHDCEIVKKVYDFIRQQHNTQDVGGNKFYGDKNETTS